MIESARALLANGHSEQEVLDYLLQMAPSYAAARAALTQAKH